MLCLYPYTFTLTVQPLQIVSLNLEPAPGAAKLRPLAASDGQENVLQRAVQALPSHGRVAIGTDGVQFISRHAVCSYF